MQIDVAPTPDFFLTDPGLNVRCACPQTGLCNVVVNILKKSDFVCCKSAAPV